MYLIETINHQKFKNDKIQKQILTCAAALAKLSKALVIAAVLFWLFVVSVLILQSIWRLVVVVLNDDDDDDDGGERKTARNKWNLKF